MCLIVCAWRTHPRYALVVAANRDEFYKRRTDAAGRWADAPQVIAGRDREQGGTWLGITESGRFAAITNVRGMGGSKNAPSRGLLVRDFLLGSQSARQYAGERSAEASRYAGFNLLLGDGEELIYFSNQPSEHIRALPAGIHALSNGHIDEHWPKMRKVEKGLTALCEEEHIGAHRLFDLMADRQGAPADELPNTGVGRILERQLSPVFIHMPVYGTRCTTAITRERGGRTDFSERRFNSRGEVEGQTDLSLQLPSLD